MAKLVALGDEIELSYGKGLPQRSRVPGNYPVFGSNGTVDTHKESLVNGPGIIVGRKGSVGEVIWTDENFWPIDTTYFVKLKNQNDSLRYWYYQLKTLGLDQLNSHSAIPGLNRDVAYAKRVIKRPPKEQKEIADVLGAIDDKIELNRKMNKTLEQMGQALFRHYFINNPKAKGWNKESLTELMNIISGGTPKTSDESYWGGDIPWFSVVDAPRGSDLFTIYTTKNITENGLKNSSAKIIPKYTTIISARGTVGKLTIAGREMTINQSCYALKFGKPFYGYLLVDHLLSNIKSRVHGSVFDTITRDTFDKLTFQSAPLAHIEEFEDLVKPLFKQILRNVEESQNLQMLRDSLFTKTDFWEGQGDLMPLVVDIDVPYNAIHLQQKIDELDSAIQQNHASKMFDAAKSLVETIFRTIITDVNGQVSLQNEREPSLMHLYEQAKTCLTQLSDELEVSDKLNELCKKAVQTIGYCRNNYGCSSHGQDAYTADDINPIEAVFVSNTAVSLVNFLYGKHVTQPTSYLNVRLIYGNYVAFNEYLDEINEMVLVSGITMTPSEALFMTDQSAYRELLIEFTEHEIEDNPDDEN